MIKKYVSAGLFKKNREADGLIVKEELNKTVQQLTEVLNTSPEIKEAVTSSETNLDKSSLAYRFQQVLQRPLAEFGIGRKGEFFLNSLSDSDVVRKWPIWPIFRKPSN